MKYRTVLPQLWTSRALRALPAAAPSAQLLLLYLLTCPEATAVPGVVCIGPAALAEALRWSVDDGRAQLDALVAVGLAQVDTDARLVWLPSELTDTRPANPNVARHWALVLREAPDCDLRDAVVRAAWKCIEPLGHAFAKPFRELFGELLAQPFGQPSRNHEHDLDHKSEHEHEGVRGTPVSAVDGLSRLRPHELPSPEEGQERARQRHEQRLAAAKAKLAEGAG